MLSAKLRSFLVKASAYCARPEFADREIERKLQMGADFRVAKEAYRRKSADAFHLLRAAFQNQNLVDWRPDDALLRWLERRPARARASLGRLWYGAGTVDQRFRAFSEELHEAGTTQTGAHLRVTSLLLMGISPTEYPHVITRDFAAAFDRAGYPGSRPDQDAAARYRHALSFFDLLVRHAPELGVALHDRLDARAVAWCVGRGVDPREYGAAPRVAHSESIDEESTLRLIKAAAKGRKLPETEKTALILSRRGQGRFRKELLKHWGKCAVTGCRAVGLLRASHIKPWKESTNAERLDKYNGLLLTPALDAALDRGLITFTDRGAIRLSSSLSAADRKCLGLRGSMKLGLVEKQHRAYLRFHRAKCFQK